MDSLKEKSMFDINYGKLPESHKTILNEKINCFICSMKIKNENPYFCYKCQKLYHNECLKEWDKARQTINKCLSCPNCRNELSLNKWNKKLHYEENRNFLSFIMNKLNHIDNNSKNEKKENYDLEKKKQYKEIIYLLEMIKK